MTHDSRLAGADTAGGASGAHEPRTRTGIALLGAAAMIATSVVWGRHVQQREPRVQLGAAPLVGAWQWRPSWRLLPAIAIAVLVVWWGPRIAAKARMVVVTSLTAALSVAFTVALAASDGWAAILAPVVHPSEYWANLDTLPRTGVLLRHFASYDFQYGRSVHLKGHPPGFIVLLKAMAAIGLERPVYAGVLSFVGVGLIAAAVLVTVGNVGSTEAARRTAPFLIVTPYAIWMGTSADAFYAGVVATGVATAAVGLRVTGGNGRSGWGRPVGWGLMVGLVLGWALFLSYGVTTALVLPTGLVALAARRTGPLALERRILRWFVAGAMSGAAAVFAVFWWAGFWWPAGLRLTKRWYWTGTAHWRPWPYFLLANVAVLLIAVGPAAVAGMVRLMARAERRQPEGAGFDALGWIVGATLVGVLLADASQYSKGEVERIWLLFMPWLVVAGAVLSKPRRWLAAQAVLALVLQAWLVSKW